MAANVRIHNMKLQNSVNTNIQIVDTTITLIRHGGQIKYEKNRYILYHGKFARWQQTVSEICTMLCKYHVGLICNLRQYSVMTQSLTSSITISYFISSKVSKLRQSTLDRGYLLYFFLLKYLPLF